MVVIQLIFGFPIGGIISAFPTMPTWLIFSITILGIPSLCYLIYRKFFDTEVTEGQQPNFIQRNKRTLATGVILGGILSGFQNLRSLDCDLTIDNGTIKLVKVEYYDRTKDFNTIEIPSGSFKTITLPIGDNILTVNGKKKNIKMGQRDDKYIFNIDGVNNYVLTEISYGSDIEIPREIKNYNSAEFFKVNADYLFVAPESIITKRGSSKKKLVLYKINNTTK
jgi:hypothetical protein